MNAILQEEIRETNNELGAYHLRAREALQGRQDFRFESIQAISAALRKMAPIVAQAAGERGTNTELDRNLREYTDNLSALQRTLEQVQFMLLARQSSLEASRSHLETMRLWAARLGQTR